MTAPTQATAREAVEVIEKALAGKWGFRPTPGPWYGEFDGVYEGEGRELRRGRISSSCGTRGKTEAEEANNVYIAACNPENIRAVLALLAAKQEELERLMGDLRSSDEHRLELQKANLLLAEEVDKMREALKDILKKPWPVTNGVSDFQAFRANELFIAELKQIARAALSPSQQGEPK